MSSLADALIAELDDAALGDLADRLRPLLTELQAGSQQPRPWLDSKGAAAYLGISTNALHKLTAARSIPFEQERPGCKCWFRPTDLDAWRCGHAPAAKAQPRHLNHA